MELELQGTNPTQFLYMACLGAFVVAMFLESFLPRRALSGSLPWRWCNNFSLSLLTWYASAYLATMFYLWLAGWTQLENLGLLQRLDVGLPAQIAALLLVTQFLAYWLHRALHRFAWLWPLHAVHHSDTEVDVSTSFRHHPLEPLLSLPVVMPAVMLLGVSPEAALYYRVLDVSLQVFNHSNICIPGLLERWLRYLVVTPDFHRTHHNAEQCYTDSNYGTMVPWFDYCFGTARHQPCEAQVHSAIGLAYFRGHREARLDQLLLQPFQLWRRGVSGVSPVARQSPDDAVTPGGIDDRSPS